MSDSDRVTWRWQPYQPNGSKLRVREKSPLGFEWCCEGGQYLVLRWNASNRRYEEAGRGVHARARLVWYAVHAARSIAS